MNSLQRFAFDHPDCVEGLEFVEGDAQRVATWPRSPQGTKIPEASPFWQCSDGVWSGIRLMRRKTLTSSSQYRKADADLSERRLHFILNGHAIKPWYTRFAIVIERCAISRCHKLMPEFWSREEVEAAVADYFDMLVKELSGVPFNKAEHNRRLQQILPQRARGSIERKHQNISAVLIELGYPYVDGYKPLRNYQQLLRAVIEERLARAVTLHEAAEHAVERPVEAAPNVREILSILVPPPVRADQFVVLKDALKPPQRAVRRNYLEAEARNRSLGRAGEEFVLRYEHERLWRAGNRALADRIEYVAQTKGDHLGYDILSFEENGRERLIEVKTTRFGAMTPFFATRNEVDVSDNRDAEYQLYRLFKFTDQPRLFVLTGSLRDTCDLQPNQFSALPK